MTLAVTLACIALPLSTWLVARRVLARRIDADGPRTLQRGMTA